MNSLRVRRRRSLMVACMICPAVVRTVVSYILNVWCQFGKQAKSIHHSTQPAVAELIVRLRGRIEEPLCLTTAQSLQGARLGVEFDAFSDGFQA